MLKRINCKRCMWKGLFVLCILILSACGNGDKKENKKIENTQITQQEGTSVETKNQDDSKDNNVNQTLSALTSTEETSPVSDGKNYIWKRDKSLKSHYVEGIVYSMSGNEQGNAKRVWINVRSIADSSKYYRVCTNEYGKTVEWIDKSIDKEGGILGKKVKIEYQGKVERQKDDTNRLTYDENGKQVLIKNYEVTGVIAITQEDAGEYVWRKDSKLESKYIDGIISDILEQKDKKGNVIRTRLHLRRDENPQKLFIVYTRDCNNMAKCIQTTKGDWRIGTKIKVEYQGEIGITDSLSQNFQFQPKEDDEVYEVKGVVSIMEEKNE